MILKFFQKLDNSISYLFYNAINEKKFLKYYFKKKKITFIDIGANVGSYSDLIKNSLNIKKGYLIEPSLNACHKLSKRYNSKSFYIHNFAMSDRNRKKKIFYEYKLSSQSSLYKQNKFFNAFNDLKKISYIQTKKFDDFMDHNILIDLCKIDTQGEEFNILKGMSYFLRKKLIRLIKIELTISRSYNSTEVDYAKITNFMTKYDYKLVTISKIKYEKNKVTFMDVYFEPSK